MATRSRLRAPLLALCVIAQASFFVPARAADTNTIVVATRGQYVPGENANRVPALLLQGSKIEFHNKDPFAYGNHTLTSDRVDEFGIPIFDSGQVNYMKIATVDVSHLPPGLYGFHCNVHLMFGTLCILGTDGPSTCGIASSS
jgi:hypothetical protein